MDSRRAQAAEAAGSPREDAVRSAPSPAPHAATAALSRARPRASAPLRPLLASRPAGNYSTGNGSPGLKGVVEMTIFANFVGVSASTVSV